MRHVICRYGLLLLLLTYTACTSGADDVVADTSGCGNEGELGYWRLTANHTSWRTLTSHPGYDVGEPMPNRTCEWRLTPPNGKYVAVKVADMTNLECRSSLAVVSVLRNGATPSWNICARPVSVEEDGLPFHVGGQVGSPMIIRYTGPADKGKLHRGFKLFFSFKDPGCRVREDLTGADPDRMWFASHAGAGLWAPEAKSTCQWYIRAPRDRYISISATYIRLHCVSRWQELHVYDGMQSRRSLANISCVRHGAPYASSGRRMFISYTDAWAGSALGFNITYTFHNSRQSGCGSQYLITSDTGEIFSQPDWGKPGSTVFSQAVCEWEIRLSEGQTVSYRITDFEVWGEDDYLTLAYGNYTQRFTMATLRDLTHRLVDTGYHVIYVTFRTGHHGIDKMDAGKGFRLIYASESAVKRVTSRTWTKALLGAAILWLLYLISVKARRLHSPMYYFKLPSLYFFKLPYLFSLLSMRDPKKTALVIFSGLIFVIVLYYILHA